MFESKNTCISVTGGHDKGENVLGKTLMQFIIVNPTDKALSWGGGSKEALGNWNLCLTCFYYALK